jgi:hypothetical protein
MFCIVVSARHEYGFSIMYDTKTNISDTVCSTSPVSNYTLVYSSIPANTIGTIGTIGCALDVMTAQ